MENTTIEFMRRKRYDSIKDKFTVINPKAEEEIKKANPEEILQLEISFTNPINVKNAKIVTEIDFIKLAF